MATQEQQTGNSDSTDHNQQTTNRDTILLVDDDPVILDSMAFLLAKEYRVLPATSRPEANQVVLQAQAHGGYADNPIKVALIDMGLPPSPHTPEEGLKLINDLLSVEPALKILVLSGQHRDSNVEAALQYGAVDFIAKPANPKTIRNRIQQQIEIYQHENNSIKGGLDNLVGASAVMQALKQQIYHLADSPFPVLILGESGTGKEVIAQAIHQQSKRANKPMVAINCAAMPRDLLEAQLFGHTKGAFTNAVSESIGFFGEASDSSIFLDELGELPLPLQAKLLRVLESGEYYRLGETQPKFTNARVIAATNQNLEEQINNNLFRADLFHRLGILTIQVPPLRARCEDIPLIIEHFMENYHDSFPRFRLSDGALKSLLSYSFPGNIRELRNIVIRLGTQYPGATVGQSHIEHGLQLSQPSSMSASQTDALPSEQALSAPSAQSRDTQPPPTEQSGWPPSDASLASLLAGPFSLNDTLAELEQRLINLALKQNDHNLARTARALHINRSTLHSRIQKYDTSSAKTKT